MPKQYIKPNDYQKSRLNSNSSRRVQYENEVLRNQYMDQFQQPIVSVQFNTNQNNFDFVFINNDQSQKALHSSFNQVLERKTSVNFKEVVQSNPTHMRITLMDQQIISHDNKKQKVSSFDDQHYNRSITRSTKPQVKLEESIQKKNNIQLLDNNLQGELEQMLEKLESILLTCQELSQNQISSNTIEDWFQEDHRSNDQTHRVLLLEQDTISMNHEEPLKLFNLRVKPQNQLILLQKVQQDSKNLLPITSKFKEFKMFLIDILNSNVAHTNADRGTENNYNNSGKYQKSYKCKYCKMQFPKACSLGGHISRVHKNESINQKIVSKSIQKSQMNQKRNRLLENFIQRQSFMVKNE